MHKIKWLLPILIVFVLISNKSYSQEVRLLDSSYRGNILPLSIVFFRLDVRPNEFVEIISNYDSHDIILKLEVQDFSGNSVGHSPYAASSFEETHVAFVSIKNSYVLGLSNFNNRGGKFSIKILKRAIQVTDKLFLEGLDEYYQGSKIEREKLNTTERIYSTIKCFEKAFNKISQYNNKSPLLDQLKIRIGIEKTELVKYGIADSIISNINTYSYVADNTKDVYIKERAYFIMADNLHYLGNKNEEIEFYLKSFNEAQKIGDQERMCLCENNIGVAEATLNQPLKAKQHFDAGFALAKPYYQIYSQLLTNLTDTYLMASKFDSAEIFGRRSISEHKKFNNKSTWFSSYSQMASIFIAKNKKDSVIKYFNECLKYIDFAQYSQQTTFYFNVIQFYNEQKKKDSVNKYIYKFKTLCPEGERIGPCLEYHLIKAQIDNSNNNLTESLNQYKQVIDIIEQMRGKEEGNNNIMQYFESKHALFEGVFDVLLKLYNGNNDIAKKEKYFFESIAIAEQLKARRFSDIINTSYEQKKSFTTNLIYNRLIDKVNSLFNYTDTCYNIENRDSCDDIKREILDSLNNLQYEINHRNYNNNDSEYVSIRINVPNGTTWIQYIIIGPKCYVWARNSTSSNYISLGSSDSLFNVVAKYYGLISNKNSDLKEIQMLSKKLSKILFSPLKNLINSPKVIIIPDGFLNLLPFASLQDPNVISKSQAIILSHDISYVPSLRAYNLISEQWETKTRSPKYKNDITVVSDPIFNSNDSRVNGNNKSSFKTNFSRLPNTSNEANAIGSFFKAEKTINVKGKDAVIDSLLFNGSFLSSKIIHLATHAIPNEESPEYSRILFSKIDNKNQYVNGNLFSFQIENLQLNSELVVLSACETSLGKRIAGEGALSLSRSFLIAGVPKVISSLWNVSDASSASFFERFYYNLLNQHISPQQALRQTQIYFINSDEYKHPFFWDCYVFYGLDY